MKVKNLSHSLSGNNHIKGMIFYHKCAIKINLHDCFISSISSLMLRYSISGNKVNWKESDLSFTYNHIKSVYNSDQSKLMLHILITSFLLQVNYKSDSILIIDWQKSRKCRISAATAVISPTASSWAYKRMKAWS